MSVERKLLTLVNSRRYRPSGAEALAAELGVAHEDFAEFRRLLDELEERGELVRLNDTDYLSPRREELYVGRLSCHPGGFGFVVLGDERGSDLRIAAADMGPAMHGDLVVARVKKPRRRPSRRPHMPHRHGREGHVVKVLRHANAHVVGAYHPTGGASARLEPSDPRIFQPIRLIDAAGLAVRAGERVAAEMVDWPGPDRDGRARVVRVLGAEGSPAVDLYQIALEYGLEQEFSSTVLAEAEEVSAEIAEKALAGRTDLRGELTITIDPENAKDFDDALSLRVDPDTGLTIVHVSIADVSHFVRQDTILDAAARERALSVYLGNGVIPMLPPRLSGYLCSLVEGEDRLAKSVRMEFSPDGELVRSAIMPSIVRVDRRMSFNEVNAILEASDAAEDVPRATAALRLAPELLEMILRLDACSAKLLRRREEAGSIDLEIPDFDVLMDDEGRVIGVTRSVRDRAHSLVEEMMLMANRVVAEFMHTRHLPCVYRVHDRPDEEAVAAFAEFVEHVVGRAVDVTDRHALQALLDDVDGTPLAYPVNMQCLRSFKRAQYSAKVGHHYALHFDYYCHFTSPVRRYPDLAVHQLLEQYWAGTLSSGRRAALWRNRLAEIAAHATEAEYRAAEAEREYLKVSLLRFLEPRKGEVFEAVITGCIDIGFFVQLEDYAVEGLVKIHTLGDDFYRFDKAHHAFVGSRRGTRFRLGDRVRVKLENVNVRQRQADFTLVRDRRP